MKCLKLTSTSGCQELFRVLQDGSTPVGGSKLIAVLPEYTRPYLVHTEDGPRWTESVLIPVNKIVVCPWMAAKLRFPHTTYNALESQKIHTVRSWDGDTEVLCYDDWIPGDRIELSIDDINNGKIEGASIVEVPNEQV